MKRNEVYKLIDGERDYQDKVWNENTTASKGQHSPEEWLMYIEDYINEAKHIVSRKSVRDSYPAVMSIVRKIAAMSVCAMEQHDTPERTDIQIFQTGGL